MNCHVVLDFHVRNLRHLPPHLARVDELERVGGPVAIQNISRQQTGRYATELMRGDLAPKTIRDSVSDLSAFFRWCVGRGYLETNPFSGVGLTVRDGTRGGTKLKRRPWTVDELKKLVTILDPTDVMWPMSIIALYTGMRANEIAETRTSDVHAETKVPYVYIPEGKTESVVRNVPLHPSIVPLVRRLLKETTDGYLVPGLLRGGEDNKRSHLITKRFGRFLRKSLEIHDKRVTFHSLRNTFITAAHTSGAQESVVKQIVRHVQQDLTFGTYSGGVKLDSLHKAIKRVSFGEIDSLVKQREQRTRRRRPQH